MSNFFKDLEIFDYLQNKTYENEVIDLKNVSLVSMEGLKFYKCTFLNANFENINILNCSFMSCDLSNCEFYKVGMHGCKFENSKLVGANFSASSLSDVTFRDSLMNYISFSDSKLKKVSFYYNQMKSSEFNKLILNEFLLIENTFEEVSFINSNLKNVDLSSNFITILNTDIKNLKNATLSYEQSAIYLSNNGVNIV